MAITKKLIDAIVEELTDPKNLKPIDYMDEGDVGNLVGIAIAKQLNKEGIKSFMHGLEHGISLIDGSHDSDEVEYLHFTMEWVSPEQRKQNQKELEELQAEWEDGFVTREQLGLPPEDTHSDGYLGE